MKDFLIGLFLIIGIVAAVMIIGMIAVKTLHSSFDNNYPEGFYRGLAVGGCIALFMMWYVIKVTIQS